MSDNTVLPTGGGGDTIRTIDRATSKTQVIALDVGGEAGPESLVVGTVPVSGTFYPATQPVSIAAAVTVAQATAANLNATVTGTVTANAGTGTLAVSAAALPLPSGASTAAKQPALGTAGVASTDVISVQGIASMTALKVDGSAVTQPVSGTFFQGTQPVSGTFFQGTQPVSIAAAVTVSQATAANLNATVTGTVTAAQATAANLNATVTPLALTKGTQGATGFTVQELKDAGRNQTNYFMAAQVVSTATEALQSLTGYKGGIAVAATTTPAVVTAAKTYRIERVAITYVAIATAGNIQVNLRANLSGVVAVTSPLVDSWLVGSPAAVAGTSSTVVIDIPGGIEFAAGTGLGITVLGIGATGTAAIVGYAKVSVGGYEY